MTVSSRFFRRREAILTLPRKTAASGRKLGGSLLWLSMFGLWMFGRNMARAFTTPPSHSATLRHSRTVSFSGGCLRSRHEEPTSWARHGSNLCLSANGASDNAADEDAPILSAASPNTAMRENSRLSHAMLKVPSVDRAVAHWTSRGGRVTNSRSNGETNGSEELLSAFVVMGYVGGRKPLQSKPMPHPGQDLFDETSSSSDEANAADDANGQGDSEGFQLELVKAPKNTASSEESPEASPSHGLSYLGLSMLLKFQDQNPLLDLMTGQSSGTDATKESGGGKDDDSNVLPSKYVASAPGDGFAQIALVSNNKLAETCDFYTSLLGMDQKAMDANLLCLRYATDPESSNTSGVATTLVFENRPQGKDESSEPPPNAGCFDHLAIQTTCSIDDLYQRLLEDNESSETPVNIYMKPTPMFGSTVLGLVDPNGYQVVLFEPASEAPAES